MDFNKPWSFKYNRKKKNEEIDMYDFTEMIALRNKTVVHTILSSFDSAKDCPRQERLSRFRNFASIVT